MPDAATIVGVAGAAIALSGALLGFRRYLQQRDREAILDLAKLQGDLVELLNQKWTEAEGNPAEEELPKELRKELRTELRKARHVYEGILRGIITQRPELMTPARNALREYLDSATSKIESLPKKEQ